MTRILKIIALSFSLSVSSIHLYAAHYSEALLKTAQTGDAKAQYEIGQSIYFGKGIAKDKAKGFEWMLKAAKSGYAPAQLSVGESYYWGVGTKKDLYKAVEWYKKASDQKYPDATYELSMSYLLGQGIQQNIAKGNELKIQAAQAGSLKAIIDLGQSYYTGDPENNIPKDFKKAAAWFKQAVKMGNPSAMINLGVMHESGEGVEQSNTEALKLYLLAAKQKDALAQFNICRFYFYGVHPLKHNYENAFKWCSASAKQNDNDAKLFLGRMYAKGLGTKVDAQKALNWYKQVSYESEAQSYIQSQK